MQLKAAKSQHFDPSLGTNLKVFAQKRKTNATEILCYNAYSLKPHFCTNVHRTLKGIEYFDKNDTIIYNIKSNVYRGI